MADNLFADLIPQSKPPIIYGPPETPKPEDPDVVEGRRLENELKRKRLATGDPETDGGAKVREAEQKAAFLTGNLMVATNELATALKRDPKAAKQTWGQWAASLAGPTAAGAVNSSERRQVEAAQRGILEAALTLGTGAAYNKEQLEGYREQYFPTVNDDPENIASKGRMLRGLLVNARIAAGRAAPQIDQAMATLGLEGDPLSGGAPVTDDAKPAPPPDTTQKAQGPADTGMVDMTPEQKAAYAAFWKANPDPTPEKLGQFFVDIGAAAPGEALGNAGAIIKAVKDGAGYSTALDRTMVVRAEIAKREKFEREKGYNLPGDKAQETLLRGTGLTDEAAGLAGALLSPLRGQSVGEGYRFERDIERLSIEDSRRQMGYGGKALEIGGSLLLGSPGTAVASIGGLARQGAAGGALAGFGQGEGLEDTVVSTIVGGAGGAAVGGALGAVANRLGRPFERPDIARAAVDEGLELPALMVTGNRRAINRAGALEADTGNAAPVIQEGFADVGTAIERRLGEISQAGTGRTEEAIGESVQRAGRRFIQRSKGVADRLYGRARELSGDARITPRQSLTQLREELRQLGETPNVNQGEIDFINEVGADLTNGPLSVDAIRGLRTSIRGRISEKGLTATQAEARALRIIDALQEDAVASLPRDAANAFRRADMYYRERMVHIDDVLDRFIGGERGVARLSGEQAFRKIKTMADSDGRRLAAIMRDLTQPERLDVGATIAQSLGRTADDGPFTVDQFLRQSKKLSPSARRTIFGPDGARSIENLRLIGHRLQEIQGQVNRSRTARGLGSVVRQQAGNLVMALMGTGGFVAGGPMGGAGGAAAGVVAKGVIEATQAGRRTLSARALMSPRVTDWMLRAMDVTTPRAAAQHVNRLSTIIAREPALASELNPLHRWLTEAVTTPAAASETEGGGDDERR